MSRFVRCRHCNLPHGASVLRCPITGGTIDPASQLGELTPEVRDVFDLCGSLLAERFEVLEVLGCGAMGAVYRAMDQQTDKPVAVKVMRKALVANARAVERFIREGDATMRLDHPRIVKHVGAGTLEDESPYLVLEFLEGQALADWMRVTHPLPIGDALEITAQILAGLEAAHDEGVIHRDIKPDNIFMEKPRPGGERLSVRILDFGISKLVSGDKAVAAITMQGEVLGTPYYLAPEQIGGAPSVRAPADLWAVGVVLYEMLSGERPFDADSLPELLVRIVTTHPPEPSVLRPEVEPALDALVARFLEKEPTKRFATAGEARLALATLRQSAEGSEG